MRLHRLEINGFKSFPDRADLAFDQGVTAIVGPNGCGKSNVVDAITWVLGEQSARSLRGERMEDVIFAGSDARKPTQAAEVKLKLSGVISRVGSDGPTPRKTIEEELEESVADLTDIVLARDVEVSRRLYRSGESEYLIDGHVVRLRDVQDLLMDAGVGVKGYAVIEQGKIGQILAAKPTERRQLIEEAAGVTKYKARRRQAELKLEAAHQNLTRVDDIIFELDRQRGSLKRQAARARRYRKLREELRQWEKVLFAQRFEHLRQTVETYQTRLDEVREREQALATRVAEVEAGLERYRLELVEADSRANAARQAAHARELESGRRQQQLTFDVQQVADLSSALTMLSDDIARLHERVGPAEDEIAERRAAAERADDERVAAEARVSAEDQAVHVASDEVSQAEADVERARQEVYAGLTQANTLRNAIDRAVEARDRIAQELSRFDVEAADLRVELEQNAIEREDALHKLQQAQQALDETRGARAVQEATLGTGRIEREWREQELRGRENGLSGMTARLRSLEELEAARAEYGEGARLVLSAGDRIRHHGSVADALEVGRADEVAVAACFGELLQHVVVPSFADAERGLALVREAEAGRVGFLVLEREAATGVGASDVEVPGVRPLRDVIGITGPGAVHVLAALGPAWLAPDAAAARQAACIVPGPVSTPAGEVYRGGLLVSGAGKAEARDILQTKGEIKDLRERIAREEDAIGRLQAEVAEQVAIIARASEAIEGLAATQVAQEKAILGFELRLTRAGDEAERLGRRLQLVEDEQRRAREERDALDVREDDARRSIAALDVEQSALSDALADAQRVLLDARERHASISRRAAEARASHAALIERASALMHDVRRLEDAARELQQRLAVRRAEHESSLLRRTTLQQSVEALRQAIDDDVVSLEAMKRDVTLADEAVAEVQQAFQAHEVQGRAQRRELDEVRTRAAALEVALATAVADLTHLADSCREALDLSLEDVAAEVDAMRADGAGLPSVASIVAAEEADADEEGDAGPAGMASESDALASAEADAPREAAAEMDVAVTESTAVVSAEQAITRLKARLAALGAVNMMAIEQFDELEQRHTFLTGQRKDLVDAMAATGEAIARIDKTTRERFHEAFVAVNANFEQMFTTLFGGGRAGLLLLDQDDVLESGIDIVAQPPGKRLQSVQLLSGGEKALTAMALMFGIFKYRPSPFCLLDEIDAPLDDANIGRFVEMLRGMQEHTQFVLITHHRKTMEIADRLYGVTMEEPGVSKVLRLDLTH
jgi:chromosome segregation protein